MRSRWVALGVLGVAVLATGRVAVGEPERSGAALAQACAGSGADRRFCAGFISAALMGRTAPGCTIHGLDDDQRARAVADYAAAHPESGAGSALDLVSVALVSPNNC